METKNKLRRTNFRLIEVDESHGWREDILKACGGKITTVYLYDANVTTCLCEYTPSYYLTPLYCIPEKSFDEIDVEMQDNLADGESSNEPIYVHTHQIDKNSIKSRTQLDGTFTSFEGRKYNELFEAALEYLSSNHEI
jgi:hypothetical protein